MRKPARIHSPDPFLRAGNAVSVLPNQNPQKIVWQNRVHRIGTRIPSVSPLGETRHRSRHHHTEKKETESAEHKTECVVARRERNGTAEAEEHAPQRVLERMLSRDGIRRGVYDYISHYRERGACTLLADVVLTEITILKTGSDLVK